MNKDNKKIAESFFLYLPGEYIYWPEIQISTWFYPITDKQWKLKLRSNTIAKDVHIGSTVHAQFSNNFIDLIPPDELEATIDCVHQVPSLESALQLHSLRLVPAQASIDVSD